LQSRSRQSMDRTIGQDSLTAIVCFILVAALSSCGSAPSPVDFDRATLQGVVVDERHNPVQWAVVAVDAGDPVYTDTRGRFSVADVPRGLIAIAASHDGFEPQTEELVFSNRSQVLYLQLRSGQFFVAGAVEALHSGDEQKAVQLARQGIQLLPGDAEAQFVAALAWYATGNVVAAQSCLDGIAEPHDYGAVDLFGSDLAATEAVGQ
jgi:Carboxypeptidase regulatory-like domain